jgi:hypothetical protein
MRHFSNHFFICRSCSHLTGSTDLDCLLGNSFTFLYVDDVRASQEAQTSIACYEESFTFLYVYDVRTSQKAHAFTACYVDRFTFLYVDR